MLLMPKEAAVVAAAGDLARANPFATEHRQAALKLGVAVGHEPLWSQLAGRRQLSAAIGPLVERLKARARRSDAPSLARLRGPLDGLAAAWMAAAAEKDASAYDLRWLGPAPCAAPQALASMRVTRENLLAAVRRAWPGESAAAQRMRADIWRAAWLGDAFLDLRPAGGPVAAPTLIHGPQGAPRDQVAALLAAARAGQDGWPSVPMARTYLPTAQAAFRIRYPPPGLQFVDRLDRASSSVQSALIERLAEGTERWTFGVLDGADLGRLEPELLHRIAGLEVRIPPLPALIADGGLVPYVARALAEDGGDEQSSRAEEIVDWIDRRLGPRYPWPGHFFELARCVRARRVGRDFRPAVVASARELPDPLVAGIRDGEIDADTLLSRYCTWVYARTGSYVATAARLGIDRRTVRKRVDRGLLPIFGDRRSV